MTLTVLAVNPPVIRTQPKNVTACAGCKAEILTLDSMQSATADCGETYLSVMESNLEVLKKALL